MKKKLIIAIVALLAATQVFGQAKYVFYFIGDGMGVNQVNLTEYYLNAMQDKLGPGQLCFTQFPVASVSTTYSADSDVTDSAASGTALATGVKTNNGYLGVDAEGNKLASVARLAKNAGKKVGIMSTVGINHATPGAFYAGQINRGMYDEIYGDLVVSDFDFFAGSEVIRNSEKKRLYDDPKALAQENGYTYVENLDEFNASYADAKKMLLIPGNGYSVEYGIDRVNAPAEKAAKMISLRDMVESSVKFLTKDKKNPGFFLMAEGGRVDYACHGNDAAACIREVIDFDEAIKFAYDFYLKHPKETAIIISADHETGGIVLVPGSAKQLKLIDVQKKSEGAITDELVELMKTKGKTPLSWDEVKAFLSENFGFWKSVTLSPEDELKFFTIYTRTIAKSAKGDVSDEYGYNHDASIVSAAVDFFDSHVGIKYTTGGHSAGYVPVYAIGVGAEKFNAKTDNAKIAQAIKELARY